MNRTPPIIRQSNVLLSKINDLYIHKNSISYNNNGEARLMI